MIQSGRTKSVSEQLNEWYKNEAVNADTEWTWGIDQNALQSMLDRREMIPFRCFMIRYLLAVHEQEIRPEFYPCSNESGWLNQSAEEILQLLENDETANYEHSPRIVQRIVDLVFNDFISNQFYVSTQKEPYKEVRGSVNRGIPARGARGVLRPCLWDKNDLLRKIRAKKLAVDFSNNPDCINEDELFAFAFGLHMDCEDISFFLKKALRRSDFNLWNWKEFLLYITYRYAEGNLFEFYNKLKEFYEQDSEAPREYFWKAEENFSTQVIRERTDLMINRIKEKEYTFSLTETGGLSDAVKEYIREYKHLITNSKDYTRTVMSVCADLLQKFKGYLDADEQAARDVLRADMEEYSQGKVIIYYKKDLGLEVPEGTVFMSIEKETGKKVQFIAEKGLSIPPSPNTLADIQIDLRCTKEEEKKQKPEEQYGYISGKSVFKIRDTRGQLCEEAGYLSAMSNKSYFKPKAKAQTGDAIRVCGRISAKCVAGKIIPAGTKFYAENPKGEVVEFESLKDVEAAVYAEVWVRSMRKRDTAVKGQIIDCSIKNWKDKFTKLTNNKIGFKQNKNRIEGGVLFNYLYHPYEEDYYLKDLLEKSYIHKLGRVLEGTQLTSSKISRIESKKEDHITRNDVLTLSFLAYMSEVEAKRLDAGNTAKSDYGLRYAGFMQKTNSILKKCGYYELYAPNPYDSLLVYLLTSNEGINAYRNLWSWYLVNRPKE